MCTLKRLIGCNLFVLFLFSIALAQESRAPIDTPREPVASGPLVTATATAKRVRFVSPGTVVQLRLEVYNEAGQKLFDTELHGGNVLDWHLQDGAGERLSSGSYATVLTIKSLSGRLSQRVGLVTINDEKTAIEAAGAGELSMAQHQAIGPVVGSVEGNAGFTILQPSEAEAITAVTHDGTQGQLTSTTGALTFRTGNVFAGKDKEQMRITEDGRVGVGTDKPEATLDVAGTVRVSDGLRFADGTTLAAAAGKLTVHDAKGDPVLDSFAAGTGTQNQVAKWTETGGAGTLGDSAITEVGGKVGIGITNPTYKLVVGPDIGPGLTTSDLTISRGPGQSVSIYAGASGSNGMNFGWDQANQRAFVNAPVQSPITFTHGGVSERMRIATDGNVGIGVTNPQSKLDVNGTVQIASGGSGGQVVFAAPNGESGMLITGTSRADIRFDGSTLKLLAGVSTGAPLATNGIVISTSGNVGMGFTNPTTKLQVLSTASGVSAVYGESATGRGVWGKSTSSRGVYGESVSLEGVLGVSTSGAGVSGGSASGSGVYGESAVSSLTAGGVYGRGTGSGSIGVIGESNIDNAVGVFGVSTSPGGVGVYARNFSAGRALFVEGDAGQSRDKAGLVKAMVSVNAAGTIVRCYNGIANSSSGLCGFSVRQTTQGIPGRYTIDFGFQVNDRFVSVTAEQTLNASGGVNIGTGYSFLPNPNEIFVRTFISDVDFDISRVSNPFMIIVY